MILRTKRGRPNIRRIIDSEFSRKQATEDDLPKSPKAADDDDDDEEEIDKEINLTDYKKKQSQKQ